MKTLVLPFGQKIAVWDASPLRTNRRAEDCQQENNIRGLLQGGCGAEGGLPFRLPRRCGSCRVSRQDGFFQHENPLCGKGLSFSFL